MQERREKNAKIFEDTEFMYQNHTVLKSVVENSINQQKLILSDHNLEVNCTGSRTGKIIVSGKKTLEASEVYAKQGKKVCVLNFASATNPGGGVINGASAQEESICRCSTLYPCLDTAKMWNKFYTPHRKENNPLYNNDIIFTPKVKVFKSDSNFPELIQESEWWDVDVITCAAPNLRHLSLTTNSLARPGEITYMQLQWLLYTRIKKIFEAAVMSGADVLILGAFGCGAFRNPARLVAREFAESTKEYRNCFDVIEYAVFHVGHERENYDAFKKEMEQFL